MYLSGNKAEKNLDEEQSSVFSCDLVMSVYEALLDRDYSDGEIEGGMIRRDWETKTLVFLSAFTVMSTRQFAAALEGPRESNP